MSETTNPVPAPLAAAQPLRVTRNVLANWGGFLLSAVVNFLLAPFVVRHLGDSLYGISVLFMALTGYLGLLDLGVRGAVTRYVSRFHARAEHAEAGQVASAALGLFGAAGALVTLISLLLALQVESLPIPKHFTSLARILFLLAGPNVAISLVSGVFSGILMALQRFEHVNVVGVVSTVLRAVAIVLALRAGGGLIDLVWIQLLTTFAATSACAWISFRLYPELHIRLRQYDQQYFFLVLAFSGYSFSLLVFDSLLIYLNSVVVGALGSAGLVTFFWIAANLINFSRAIVGGISKTSTPLASALEAQGDRSGLQRSTQAGATYATAVVLPIAAVFLLRGESFIGLWMGPQYAELSGHVLWVLTLGLAFSASNQVALATMLGISRHRALVPVFLAQTVCNLALSVALARPMGLLGVAWGITLPYLAVSLLFWPAYLRHTLGIRVGRYALATWVRPALAVVPFAFASYAVEELWPASNLVFFFLQTAAVFPLALVGFWFLCLTQEDRQKASAWWEVRKSGGKKVGR